MLGKTFEKFCPSCNKVVQYTTSILYKIDREEYTDTFICPECNKDLAIEDRALIQKSRYEVIDISYVSTP